MSCVDQLKGYAPDEDLQLDTGIKHAVIALRRAGVETFEFCQGGSGHAYPESTVRFHGGLSEGYRAVAAAMDAGLPIAELRPGWPILDGEVTGPWWELTFVATSRDD